MRFLICLAVFLMPMLGLAERPEPCHRFNPGTVLTSPPDLFSIRGKLELTFSYKTRIDNTGNVIYCFVTAEGKESPTLHIRPGDDLIIHLKSDLPPGAVMAMASMPEMSMSPPSATCGTGAMTTNSVNLALSRSKRPTFLPPRRSD
jgi:hypothetical protein